MKKETVRIIILISLTVFFVMIYTVVDAAYKRPEVKFGYWVSTKEEEECRNFVILGTDKDEVRTDLILFCQYRENDHKLAVLQIPRDTRVETERFDKKINSAYGSKGGIEQVKTEVASLTGIYPDNYIVLNFKGFCELVDGIGGIEFNVPMRMYYTDPVQDLVIDLQPGMQHLNGKQAEMFMRFRKNNNGTGYAEGDVGRLKAQKNFYNAVIHQILSVKSIGNIGDIMNAVGGNLKTDFTIYDLMSHIDDLNKVNTDSVNILMLPGNGEYISENGQDISYFICDREKTSAIMREYFKYTN